ncbi:MAG: hypothetical protein WC010_03980 [Candidatus Absconditabacterales bacterium]
MKIIAPAEKSLDNNTPPLTSIQEIIAQNNKHLVESMYISFAPKSKDIGRCYRTDFTLEIKKDAQKLVDQGKAIFYHKDKEKSDFFVYNERTGELVPFNKNDYRIHDHGYMTFDGTDYISYDDHGQEVSKFSYIDDIEDSTTNIPGIQTAA